MEALEPRFLLDGSQSRFDVLPRIDNLTRLVDAAPVLIHVPIAASSPSDSPVASSSPSPPPAQLPPTDASPVDWANSVLLPDAPRLEITGPAAPQAPTTPTGLATGPDAPGGFGLKSGPGSDPVPPPAPGPIIGPVPGPAPIDNSTPGLGPFRVWYQIPVDSSTVTLKFKLSPQSAGQPLDEGMAVFDSSGRNLGDLPPGSKADGLSVPVPMMVRGFKTRRWLYLEIAAAPQGSAASPTTPAMSPFVLVISREFAASPPGELPTTGDFRIIPLPSGAVRTGLADGGPQASPNPASSQGTSPLVVLTSAPIGQGPSAIPAATGPLPARSAAPWAGCSTTATPSRRSTAWRPCGSTST